MSAVDEILPPRPIPTPTEISRPHWDGCRRGELLFQRCGSCASAVFPPALICPTCHAAELAWERSSGRGTVYSHTVVWRPQTPAFQAPYVVGVVELAEGWHMFTNIVGCPTDTVTVGMAVDVEFVAVDGDAVLPCFVPREDGEPRR